MKLKRTPIHCNGDLVVGVEVATTGPEVGFHEPFSLSIIPLLYDYRIDAGYPMLELMIAPSNHERTVPAYVRKWSDDYQLMGHPWHVCVELLDHWFEKVRIEGKRLIPMVWGARKKLDFLETALTRAYYKHLFSDEYRCTYEFTRMVNDIASACGDKRTPFPKHSLFSVARRLGIQLDGPKTAAYMNFVSIQVYRTLQEREARLRLNYVIEDLFDLTDERDEDEEV